MIERRVNTPVSSSAGRLFDAVSAILGIRGVISYEAQAAIELEVAAGAAIELEVATMEDTEEEWYLPPPDWIENGAWRGGGPGATTAGLPRATATHRSAPSSTVLKTGPLVRQIVADILRGEALGRISARFHAALAGMFVRAAIRAREETGIECVGLSGGVFQNVRLFNLMCDGLEEAGFQVLVHSEVPTNDGGLSFGQAAVAAARLGDESAARLGDESAVLLSDGPAALSRNGG